MHHYSRAPLISLAYVIDQNGRSFRGVHFMLKTLEHIRTALKDFFQHMKHVRLVASSQLRKRRAARKTRS